MQPRLSVRPSVVVLVVAVVVLAVLGYVFASLRRTAVASFRQQIELRDTRRLVARALSLQLDQSTLLRSYTSTHEAGFLREYGSAKGDLDETLGEIKPRLQRLQLEGSLAAERDAERVTREWFSRVATPMIADPSARNVRGRTVLGESLVGRFRSDLLVIDRELSAVITRVEQRIDGTLRDLFAVGAGLLGFLTLALMVAYFRETRLAAVRAAYESERRIARRLQEALLRPALPQVEGLQLDAVYVPAGRETLVGGDWYDALRLPDGRLLLSIGDVSGHGIDAAVTMNRARQAIVFSAAGEWEPAAVLAKANAALLLEGSSLVSALCVFIDPLARVASFSGAGHPPPILLRRHKSDEHGTSGKTNVLPLDGLLLAIEPTEYHSFYLHDLNDVLLVLYTDGVSEFHRDPIAGEAVLRKVVEELEPDVARPALEIYRRIFGGAAPLDDVAILTVSFP
ncbi:MAG: SpoIIE family protein phosphatase, partial [Candidatus Eremiobacteraeota bacterium]|nr:SpoIIE family protein phosphatase [Candidatus Eremiobacteraeota bacterium]